MFLYEYYLVFCTFVLLSEKSRFLLLKVTTFIIPGFAFLFHKSSSELHMGRFECFSPFMVTAREVLAITLLFKSPVVNTQLSEYVVIIPKSLHLGLLPYFIPLGTELRVLKADWQHKATERETC